jgi:HAD superfamily hydrolase (TIGR01509 family)
VNTWPWHRRAIDMALKPYGKKLADLDPAKMHNVVGRRTRDAFDYLRQELGLSTTVVELVKTHHTVDKALCDEYQTLMPGAVELLERLKTQGLRLAVVSSGRKPYVESVLEKWGLRKYFDDIIGGDEVTIGKPGPEPYLNALKDLCLLPADCVVVEDSQSGIESAKAAGCYCIAVRNPNTPPQDCSRADLVVDSLVNINISA